MIRIFFTGYLLSSNLLPLRLKIPKLPKVRIPDALLEREVLLELEKLLKLDELLELVLPDESSKSLEFEELISKLLELEELLKLPELLVMLMLAVLIDAPRPMPNPVLVELLLPKPIPPRLIPAYAVLVRKSMQVLKTKIDLFILITSNSVNRLCLLLVITVSRRI